MSPVTAEGKRKTPPRCPKCGKGMAFIPGGNGWNYWICYTCGVDIPADDAYETPLTQRNELGDYDLTKYADDYWQTD